MRRDSGDAGQVGETHRPARHPNQAGVAIGTAQVTAHLEKRRTRLEADAGAVSVSVPLSGSPGLPRNSDKIDDPGNEAP